MTSFLECDPDRVKTNQHAKYLDQRSFSSKVIVRTHTHTPRMFCSTWTTEVVATKSAQNPTFGVGLPSSTLKTKGLFYVPGLSLSQMLWIFIQNLRNLSDRTTHRHQLQNLRRGKVIVKTVKPRLHDTTGCQTGCTTGMTTGCIV